MSPTAPGSPVFAPSHGRWSVAELLDAARRGELGTDPASLAAAGAFLTIHGTRHPGRRTGYRNAILSMRVCAAVGSCALEPDDAADLGAAVESCPGTSVADLLGHELPAVRIAALDAYLMQLAPHPRAGGAVAAAVPLAAGTSLDKSRQRAAALAGLLPAHVRRVAVIGVVNSVLAALRERRIGYLPCDLAGGRTEWDEPIHTDPAAVLPDCDALLITGMTLVNGSFDEFVGIARARQLPAVAFAQTGSAVLPWFLGSGLTAVSAEPYPFFSLDGGPSTVFHYRAEVR